MRVLVAIVHHWNPSGSGRHASLRPDPRPRRQALQDQLLALRRLAVGQGMLSIAQRCVDDANQALRHQITIKVVTDGEHHVLEQLDPSYRSMLDEVATQPPSPMELGFEAHRVLADALDDDYDLYAYFEDDLLILDPFFFHKIFWFQQCIGSQAVLLPQRFEFSWQPEPWADRFYIDGPMEPHEIMALIPDPPAPIATALPGGQVSFSSPSNPHSGCFVLTQSQLRYWSSQSWFLDRDASLISPLESAATLGLLKTFQLYKPHPAYAAFLEIQHWGMSFRSLIGKEIQAPDSPAEQDQAA